MREMLRLSPGLMAALLIAATVPAVASPIEAGGEACGYLPYRANGEARFTTPRTPEGQASVGPQTTYPFAWDLARPAMMTAEVAEDVVAGKPMDAVRGVHGAALSLGEYMLHAAQRFETPPEVEASDDPRVRLAARRPVTFHEIYVHSKASFDGLVAVLAEDAPAEVVAEAADLALAWRPAYALVARAQADDKRLELLSTDLDADAVAEKEAVACLAHAVAVAAEGGPNAGAAARAAAARWETRPSVNARSLPRAARSPFFDYEDAGEELAQALVAAPDGEMTADQLRPIAKTYATFVAAAKSLHQATRPTQ